MSAHATPNTAALSRSPSQSTLSRVVSFKKLSITEGDDILGTDSGAPIDDFVATVSMESSVAVTAHSTVTPSVSLPPTPAAGVQAGPAAASGQLPGPHALAALFHVESAAGNAPRRASTEKGFLSVTSERSVDDDADLSDALYRRVPYDAPSLGDGSVTLALPRRLSHAAKPPLHPVEFSTVADADAEPPIEADADADGDADPTDEETDVELAGEAPDEALAQRGSLLPPSLGDPSVVLTLPALLPPPLSP